MLSPETERLQQEWARASTQLFAVHAQRLAGNASRKDLVDAAERARVARTLGEEACKLRLADLTGKPPSQVSVSDGLACG